MARRNYPGVDIMKFFFALSVFYMHVPPFSGPVYEVYLKPIICRLAVPYFFVATGYFFGIKVYSGKVDLQQNLKNTISRLLPKLIVFELIAMCFETAKRIIHRESVSFIITEAIREILFYPRGAVWYIQAVIVALVLLSMIVRRKRERLIIPIGVVLYTFLLISNRYYFIVQGTPLSKIVNCYNDIFITARNGLFWGFLFVGMGMLIAKNEQFFKNRKVVVSAFSITYLLYIFEIYVIKDLVGIGDRSTYIMHLILIPLLFVVTTYVRIDKNTTFLRKLSVSIYLLHPPVYNVVRGVSEIIIETSLPDYILSIIVLILVIGISFAVFKSKIRFLNNLIS